MRTIGEISGLLPLQRYRGGIIAFVRPCLFPPLAEDLLITAYPLAYDSTVLGVLLRHDAHIISAFHQGFGLISSDILRVDHVYVTGTEIFLAVDITKEKRNHHDE